jgi:acyl-homoserine-lactone acylase
MMKMHRTFPAAFLLAIALIPQSPGAMTRVLESSSLTGQVTIRRDTFGIPHILAETEEAAAFGFGYAQAEDHGLIIARELVRARGEEAKYFGAGIDNDFLLGLYDNLKMAAKDLQGVGPLHRKMVEAFAEGLNAYFARHRNELPPWIPRFTGIDIMANRRAGAIRQTASPEIIEALRRKYPPPGPRTTIAAEIRAGEEPPGSNAFALLGSRTDSGCPILLGNPHLDWASLYWEAQVTVPGVVDFFGSTLAGYPVLRAGFNEHLGWVTTNNSPPTIGIFALPLDPNRADHYLFNGESRPLIKREISVEIRGQVGSPRKETKTYWDSPLGKILYRTPEKAFAVDSTLLDAYRSFEEFYELSKTQSLQDFIRVLDRNWVPMSNFTYADAAGNILYYWNARIAARPDDGTDYRLDVPAENDKYLWTSLVAPSSFPRLLNPKGGYIQNCNNPPWFTSLRDPLDPTKYPGYLEGEIELGLRPQAMLGMLNGEEKLSLEEAAGLKFNTRLLLADRVKPDLLQALRDGAASSADLRNGLRIMEDWDNRVAADSRGGILFTRFWDTYSRACRRPFRVLWDRWNPATTPSGLSDASLALKHFEAAVRWTRETYGSADVAWGDVHRYRFGSLDLPGDGADGSYGLVRVVRFADMPDGRKVAGLVRNEEPPVGFGDAWVMAVQFSKPIKALSVLAYGQSSSLSSTHSGDQIGFFAAHRLRPIWFREEEIKAHMEEEYHPDESRRALKEEEKQAIVADAEPRPKR